MIIYKLISPSGKVYIGQTKNSVEFRWNQHIKSWERWKRNRTKRGVSSKLYFALDKHSPENWKKEVLCECFLKEELDEKEEYYIQLYDSVENGYNITKGGSGRKVFFLDEEHKENLSKARKQYYDTEEGLEWKEKLSKKFSGENNPMYGKTYTKSEETKKLISEKMKGKNLGKDPWNKGKPLDEEYKKKISEGRKGKGLGRDNSKNMKGKSQTEYQKQRASETKGKIWIIIDPNGNEFEIFSLNKFCKENGLDQGNLSRGKHKGYKAKKKE